MRALIIISVSRATVIEPSSTSATNRFTRSLPRSRVSESRPTFPCSRIWSSSPSSPALVNAAAWPLAACVSAILRALRQSKLGAQFVHLFRIAKRRLKHFIELLIGLQRPSKIGELRAQLEELRSEERRVGRECRARWDA